MKALVTINDNMTTVIASDEEELLMFVKDELVNELDERMDAINEVLYDESRGRSESTIEDLQSQYNRLEDEHARILRASSIGNLRNLGYDVEYA